MSKGAWPTWCGSTVWIILESDRMNDLVLSFQCLGARQSPNHCIRRAGSSGRFFLLGNVMPDHRTADLGLRFPMFERSDPVWNILEWSKGWFFLLPTFANVPTDGFWTHERGLEQHRLSVSLDRRRANATWVQIDARQTITSVVSDEKKCLPLEVFIRNVNATHARPPQSQLFLEFREHRFSNSILSLEFCKESEVEHA